MQKNVTTQLKIAFIKQAHEQDKMITLAIFVKELEENLEVAQFICAEYAHEFPQYVQMHMKNMLEAQLKMNAGADCIVKELLKHVETLATDTTAEQETQNLLNKFKLH